jgi:hypothetical protein
LILSMQSLVDLNPLKNSKKGHISKL